MKAEIIGHSVISVKNAGKLNYNAWPSVLSVGGELLCAWSGGRHAHICPFGKVNAAKSTDGGRTWQPPYTVLYTPLDDRDAGLCAAGGNIILTSFNNSRRMQRYYAEEYRYEPAVKAFYEGYLNLITDDDEKRYLGSLTAVIDGRRQNLFRADCTADYFSARAVRNGGRKNPLRRPSLFR